MMEYSRLMLRRTLALMMVASSLMLLAGCPSSETTEQAETTTTETTTETTASTAPSPAADADAVPADWKTVESKDHGITFAHPPGFKIVKDDLKAGSASPMYIAGDEHMMMAVLAIPNAPTVTSQLIADEVFKAMVTELKLTEVKKEAPVDQKDAGGFTSWTDIDASAKFEGKVHTVTAGGGKAPDKAKSSVGLFVLYPEGEKNDDVFSKVYSSLVTLE